MKHLLKDGRELMASYNDIQTFFERNNIVGKIIKEIKPKAFASGNIDYFNFKHIMDFGGPVQVPLPNRRLVPLYVD